MIKKTTIISVLIMALFIISIILILSGERKNRVKRMYEEINKNGIYTFSMEETMSEMNYKVSMAQRNEDISIDMYMNNEHTTTLIIDNKSYFIMHNEKKYYDYGEEKIDSDIITSGLKNILQKEYSTGVEEINGIKYYYEEYEDDDMNFVIYSNVTENSKIKTRFYFEENKLCYIKNIVQNDEDIQEELIKTELEYKIDEEAFKIPKDYIEAEE